MRPLAFIDLETTGLDPARHEILEIGVIRVHGDTLEELEHAEVRVRPGRIGDADPEALRVNGYSPGAWKDAVPIEVALARVALLLEGALLAGHNVWFDRAFLDAGWRRAGVTPPEMDHHVLDTATLVWPLMAIGLVDTLSLLPVCERLGIDTDEPHRALADARRSLELARCLLPEASLLTRVRALEADERSLVETIVARIDAGRRDYGPWRTDDERVRGICRALTESGFLPIAPHVYLPQFLDEKTERERALSLCLEMVGTCDELRVYGGRVTAGMRREIEHAERRGIPVRFAEEVA